MGVKPAECMTRDMNAQQLDFLNRKIQQLKFSTDIKNDNYKKLVHNIFGVFLKQWKGSNEKHIMNAVVELTGPKPQDDITWYTTRFLKCVGDVFAKEPVDTFQYTNDGIFAKFFVEWFTEFDIANVKDFGEKLTKKQFIWFLEWLENKENNPKFASEKLTAPDNSSMTFNQALEYVRDIVVLPENEAEARRFPWLINFTEAFDNWHRSSWKECYKFKNNTAHLLLTLRDGLKWTDQVLSLLGLDDDDDC